MVRIRGGRGIPIEGMLLVVAEDAEGKFFTEPNMCVDHFIPVGSKIHIKDRCGAYCELTLDSGMKSTEAVIRFENGKLLPISQLPIGTEVRVKRNGT